MSKNARNLAVVGVQPARQLPQPPGKLGEIGMSLWRDIVQVYEFNDRASYETLFQAAAAAERAASLRALIDRDGELLKTKTGLKDNPLLKHELAARAFVVRSLARLGLDLEPVRDSVGRPPGVGYRADQA